MGSYRTPLDHKMAEAIALMIQAMRMGDYEAARYMGVVALAGYASEMPDTSVDKLLEDADPEEVPIPEFLRSRVPVLRVHDPDNVTPDQFLPARDELRDEESVPAGDGE